MEEYINNESVETQEVADPEYDDYDFDYDYDDDTEESVETQDVADPEYDDTEDVEVETGRTPQDSAFADMRRRNEELQHENDELMAALSRFFEGDNARDLSINANAYAEQRDPDEYRAEYERLQELETLRARNEELETQLMDAQVSEAMRNSLREIQEIDPSVKELDDLGENFLTFIANGMTSTQAYFASKAMDAKTKTFAPDAIGRVSDTKIERDYYTSEEIDNLTDEELEENWDKVQRSMNRL